MPATPAAIVLTTLAAPPDPSLGAVLGEEAADALGAELAARARRWAAAAAPDRAFEATSVAAAAMALHDHAGPVLLAAPDVPGLSADLADAALGDLAAGARLVVAPTNDGSAFLLAVPGMDEQLLDAAAGGFEALVAAAAARGEGGLGMLRSERRLVSAADARALAADPCAPEELLRHLRTGLPVRRAAI